MIEGARIPDLRNHNPQGTNKNIGNEDTLQHLPQQPESTDSKNTAISNDKETLLAAAKESLRASRQTVEKLIDSISKDDHYSLGILGPILSGWKDAETDFAGI